MKWEQGAGVYPWRARTPKGQYEVASYLGAYGPRFLAWFKDGRTVTAVSDMTGDIEAVKAQAEAHARNA